MKLAEDHWSYIKALLHHSLTERMYTAEEVVEMIGFHYITAMEHGYKHGKEENESTKR